MPPIAPAFWMFRAFSANIHWPLCIKAIFSFTASGLVISEQPLYGLMVTTNPLVCVEKQNQTKARELEQYVQACKRFQSILVLFLPVNIMHLVSSVSTGNLYTLDLEVSSKELPCENLILLFTFCLYPWTGLWKIILCELAVWDLSVGNLAEQSHAVFLLLLILTTASDIFFFHLDTGLYESLQNNSQL